MKDCIEKLKHIINSKKKLIMILLSFIILYRVIYSYYIFNFKYTNNNYKNIKEVMVIELKASNQDKVSYLVRYDKNNFLLNIYSRNGKEVDQEKYNQFKYGDKLKINGKITIPKLLKNPNEFNYKRYLNSNKIVGNINTFYASKVGEKYGNIFLKGIYSFKTMLGEKITSSLPKDKSNLLKSMIYGDRLNIDKDIEESLRNNGLAHIIAVSGTNISYLLMILSILFNEQCKKHKLYFNIIITIIFCSIASFSISILRATIMNIISLVCKYFNIKLKKYTAVIISAITVFLYNPFCIFNISFVFSYLAVIGIITYQNEICSLFYVKVKRLLRYNYIEKNKKKIIIYNILNAISKIVGIYISVQILVLPFQIYYFGEFSITSILSNLIIYPVITIIFFLGFLTMFFSFIPFISNILFNCDYIMLTLLINISKYLANFNISIILPKPNFLIIIVFYFVILLLRHRKKVILIVTRKKVKLLKLFIDIFVILYLIFTFIYYINILYFENYIYFFNVEQGNMAFIRYNRKNILIDYGSTTKNLASNVLYNFCKQKGIRRIDLCIVTHMHEDHINGVFSDEKDIAIDKIVYSYPKEDIENFDKLVDIANKEHISMIESNIYDSYQFDKLEINILSPKNNEKIIASDIQNANSQVLLLSIDKLNLLFMGDATIETEKYILSSIEKIKDENLKSKIMQKLKNIQIIQIGHHGSKTSTSKEFLDYINVKKAIISAKKEKFGHPHEETIEKLKQYNIEIYITENCGAIKFYI